MFSMNSILEMYPNTLYQNMNLQEIFAETTQCIHHFDKYKCSPDKDSNALTKSPLKPVQL